MKHLVMLGAGRAHLHMLSTLRTQAIAGTQITWVAASPQPIHAGLLTSWVAGQHPLQDAELFPLAGMPAANLTHLPRQVVGLDLACKEVSLDDGSTLAFDVLSIDTGPLQDRAASDACMPGSRQHALFLHPLDAFAKLWPQVETLAQTRDLRVAVVGAGITGFELACAIRHRLPGASVTLLCGDQPVGANEHAALAQRMANTLKAKHITVIQEQVVGMALGEVTLASGARLACDVPLLATATQPPAWLSQSGLALQDSGQVTVDTCLRSVSHPHVFVAGVISDQPTNVPDLALASHLRSVLAAVAPVAQPPQRSNLQWVDCGDRRAIVRWGNRVAQGRWVWWLKQRFERQLVKALSAPQPE